MKTKLLNMLFHIFYFVGITFLFLYIIQKGEGLIIKEFQANKMPSYQLPAAMVGRCNGNCVPNKAYPCTYSTFYPVSFTKDGKWRWDCPFNNQSTVEVGVGKIIGMPNINFNTGNGWKATWYSGNQIISDPNKRIHCACYHVGGKRSEPSWMFHSFQIKIIHDGKNQSIDTACGSFTWCPETIHNDFKQVVVNPYIEKYLGCKAGTSKDV